MPVIPETSDFPSASKKGSTESQTKSGEQREKASAMDHLSKGPRIPDGERATSSPAIHRLTKETDMPPKASREEIEARMKELNKSKD
jgi:hypothetical protein